MIFRRILAATDGSEASTRGVSAAAQMAARYEAELLLITAVSVPEHVVRGATIECRTLEDYVERLAREMLDSGIAVLKRVGVGAEIKVLIGPPAETVVAETASSGADLVIMGRRSRTEPKDLLLGSVTDRIARNVNVPVLLVP